MIDLTKTCRRCGRPHIEVDMHLEVTVHGERVADHHWCCSAHFQDDYEDEAALHVEDLAEEVCAYLEEHG